MRERPKIIKVRPFNMANFSGSYNYIFLVTLLGMFTVIPAVAVIVSVVMLRRSLRSERAKRAKYAEYARRAGYPAPVIPDKDMLIPPRKDAPQKRGIPAHLKEDKLRKKAMQCENCTWEWEYDQNSGYCVVCGAPAPIDEADG